MSVFDGLSKKERLRRENEALLHEAKKSLVDRETGRLRCLSCGSVFASLTALAAHLRKHNGVNSLEYRPRRVVGTSHTIFWGSPMERPPEVKLGEFLTASQHSQGNTHTADNTVSHERVLKQDVRSPKKQEIKNGKGRKRNKISPLKRSILIQQVLSLTQKLGELRMELCAMTAHRTRWRGTVESVEMKRQVKRVQGCINSTKSELQMALSVMNQKFTFRQLVMLEFLSNRMELSTSGIFEKCMDGSESPTSRHDAIQETEHPSLSAPMAALYKEADALQETIEAAHEAKWIARVEADAKKLIETRRDAESGKVYIKKPLFIATSGHNGNTERRNPIVDVKASGTLEVDDGNDEKIEISDMQDQHHDADGKDDNNSSSSNNIDDSSLSSQETVSTDDDMRGFGDVLMEWVKKTQHNTRATSTRSQTYQFFQECDDLEALGDAGAGEVLNTADQPRSPAAVQGTDVQVVWAGKQLNNVHLSQKSNEGAVMKHGMAEEWSHGNAEDGDDHLRCIFIKPLLGIPMEADVSQGSSPGKKKKSNYVSGQTVYQDAGHQHQRHQQSCNCDQPCKTGPKFSTVSVSSNAQNPDSSLDDAVHQLLTKLSARQHEHMKNPNGEKSQRWIVSGFAEVSKHLARGSVKLIVVAKNLNESIQPKLSVLQDAAQERNVPLVFALTRKKIGQIYHVRKNMSVVALFDYQDFENLFSAILQLN